MPLNAVLLYADGMKRPFYRLSSFRRLALAGLAILLLGGLLAAGNARDESPRTQPATAPSGIGALGWIEPRSRVIDLSHDAGPEGARIEQLLVEEGQRVAKGDVIALFSDHERKQARLKSAQAQISMLEARIDAEKANQKFYMRDYQRAAKLVKTSAISVSRADDAERLYRNSIASHAALEAELTMAIAELELAKEELKQAELRSPLDATILDIHARPGERVSEQGVVELADLSILDVVAEIYERDMPRVKVGQAATIMLPGNRQSFEGTVRELGYLVRKNDLNNTDPLADRDNRVVEVRITLPDEAADALRHLIFMQVDVRLE